MQNVGHNTYEVSKNVNAQLKELKVGMNTIDFYKNFQKMLTLLKIIY